MRSITAALPPIVRAASYPASVIRRLAVGRDPIDRPLGGVHPKPSDTFEAGTPVTKSAEPASHIKRPHRPPLNPLPRDAGGRYLPDPMLGGLTRLQRRTLLEKHLADITSGRVKAPELVRLSQEQFNILQDPRSSVEQRAIASAVSQMVILRNPSEAEQIDQILRSGRRLIGVRVKGTLYTTPEIPGSSHRNILAAVGSAHQSEHSRLVIGTGPGGLEKIEVLVSQPNKALEPMSRNKMDRAPTLNPNEGTDLIERLLYRFGVGVVVGEYIPPSEGNVFIGLTLSTILPGKPKSPLGFVLGPIGFTTQVVARAIKADLKTSGTSGADEWVTEIATKLSAIEELEQLARAQDSIVDLVTTSEPHDGI